MKRFTVASVRGNLLQARHKIHDNLSLQHPTSGYCSWYIASECPSGAETLREFCAYDGLIVCLMIFILSAPFQAAQKLAEYSVVQRYSWIFWIALGGNRHYKLSGAIHYHICCIERTFDDFFCFKCIRPLYCVEVFIMCLWKKPILTGAVCVHRAKPVKRCSFPRSTPARRSHPLLHP